MTKQIYVAQVQWKEDGTWRDTNLWAFEKEKDAEAYCKWKQETAELNGNNDNSRYYWEKMLMFDDNYFGEEYTEESNEYEY